MKQILRPGVFIKLSHFRLIVAAALLLTVLPVRIFAQADSTKKQKEEPATEKDASTISPSLVFTTVQKADNTIDLKATLKAKFKGAQLKLAQLKLTFIQVTDSAEKKLGFVITDENGNAVFTAKADALTTDKTGKLHFKVDFAGNKTIDAVQEEATIKRARLEITPVREDSLLNVKIKLVDLEPGKETPVKAIVLGVYVNRMFKPLKIGEGTTDDNGEAVVTIPANLPGDATGKITLLAKLEENETYGNLEAAADEKWGIAVSDKIEQSPRALWSTHPPLWMIITFSVLVIVVWGHYIVIIYELIRLRKEEPHDQNIVTTS